MESNAVVPLIDSHCHIQEFADENELSQLICRLKEKGFCSLYTNATNIKDFESNISISINKSSPSLQIIPGIGYHPWYLDYPKDNPDTWYDTFTSTVKEYQSKGIKLFIGEIGIDGGKIKKVFPLQFQIDIFTKQFLFANEQNLLVHIHCVYEWDKLYKIMSTVDIQTLIKGNKILLHSFQGKMKHIQLFNKLNVFYSISSGCFTKSNYEMLKAIPNDKLLFESDAPSMFNKSMYDNEDEYKVFYNEETKHNSPESIITLCKKMAELKGMSEHELRTIVYNNSQCILKEFN